MLPISTLMEAPKPSNTSLQKYDVREHYKNSATGIEALLSFNEGYIVGRLNNELLRYKTDAHFLTISPTGGGKTTGSIVPNLLDHPGSAFVVDIRGETVAKTANARRLMGQRVVVVDPYNLTKGRWGIDSYNFFDRITNFSDSIDLDDRIQRIVTALMFDPKGRMSNEPIWDNATKNLLTGIISYVVKYLPRDKHNLIEVLDILNYSNSELEWFIAELSAIIEQNEKASNDRLLKGLVKILTEGKGKTKITDNALIQAQTLLAWVGNRSFEKILEYSTFTFEDLQNGNMTVYLVVPEEYIKNSASWVRLLIESAIFSMKDIYGSRGMNTANLPQKDRVLFLLDELPTFGQLDIVSEGMATLRGRGINLWLFLQNISQLDDIYGESKAKTIIGNAASIQLFNSNELYELEYFVKLIGEEFFDVQSVGFGTTETKGESTAKGTSNTISNSESVTHSKGTSDSVSEAHSINWSKSYSNSFNRSKTKNQSSTRSSGINRTNSVGSNDGTSKSVNRNGSQGFQNSNSNSSGSSKGWSKGSNKTRSTTKGSGETEGISFGETNTSGGGKTTTHAHTTNESYAYGETKGHSDTTSETFTESYSEATNRNVSVKQERMKIETIRSLREKLSNRNQLLQIRGHQPFFTPKMSYFVQFIDIKRYMFPDMLMLTELQNFDNIFQETLPTLETIDNGVFKEEILLLDNIIREMEEHEEKAKDNPYDNLAEPILNKIISLVQNDAPKIIEKIESIKAVLGNQFAIFDYLSILLVGSFNRIEENNSSESFFDGAMHTLLFHLYQMQTYNDIPILEKEKLDEYQKLPITDIVDGKDVSIGSNGYALNKEDNKWLVQLYLPVVQKIASGLKKDISNCLTQTEKHSKTKNWFQEARININKEIPLIIEKVIMKEVDERQYFFEKYNA